MHKLHQFIHRFHNPDFGILLVRVALGVVFISHGWMKIENMEQTIGFFGMFGFAPYLAYVVAYAEVIGGIAFVVGYLTRYAGIVLAVVMAVAIAKVHLASGYSLANGGYEYALTLLLGSLALFFLGSGSYSLARLLKHNA